MNDAIYYILEYFLFTGHERTTWNRKEEDESEEFAQSKKAAPPSDRYSLAG